MPAIPLILKVEKCEIHVEILWMMTSLLWRHLLIEHSLFVYYLPHQ